MRNQKGFTIIELMIATAVVSVMLLMVSIMLIGIGNLLHKGISASKVQETLRNVNDEITGQIKDSGGQVVYATSTVSGNTVGIICVNNIAYTYILGVQMGSGAGQSPHVLVRAPQVGSCTPPTSLAYFSSLPAGGVELLYPNSRLYQLSANSPSLKTYEVDVGVAYGDDDLLCSPTHSDCAAGSALDPSDYVMSDLACRDSSSRSFCATAKLSTLVTQRL